MSMIERSYFKTTNGYPFEWGTMVSQIDTPYDFAYSCQFDPSKIVVEAKRWKRQLIAELDRYFDAIQPVDGADDDAPFVGPENFVNAVIEEIEEDLARRLGAESHFGPCGSVLQYPQAEALMLLLRLDAANALDLDALRDEPLEEVANLFYAQLGKRKEKLSPDFWTYVESGDIPNVLCALIDVIGDNSREFGLVFFDALMEASQ